VGRIKVLLDTHALLWWLFDDPRLSQRARKVIASPDSAVFMSSASAWEIATKYRLGKLPEAKEVVENLPDLLRMNKMEELPISMAHAIVAGSLSIAHRDPFDRMLIAQAQLESMPVVTTDAQFKGHNIQIIW